MQQDATTEQPAPGPMAPAGEASDPPPMLLWILWFPVFAVIVWGMMLVFGRRPWDFSPDEIPVPPPAPLEGEPLHTEEDP